MAGVPFRLPRFYPIIDTTVLEGAPLTALQLAELLLDAGVRILQYRHKGGWTQLHYNEAEKIAGLCNSAGVLFVMNDRADYAKLMRAGLHVGQDDLPPAAARTTMGDEVIGLSTHNRAQLQSGDEQRVEYLSIGPIFPTQSKQNPDPVMGLDGLRRLRPLTQKPLCAIGGVTLERAPAVLEAGADSLAVIGDLLPSEAGLRWQARQVRERARLWMGLA